MRLIVALGLLVGIVVLTGNGLQSQEKKDTDKKVKGQLPRNWSKLGLSADQKAAIYKTMSKYKEEIDKLTEKVKDLRSEELREMVKLLSPEQKKKLEELSTGGDDGPKDKSKDKDK
jgi:hypothetical protein